ncbi:hypothetical protein PV755_09145 [Streptomyces caniscabiei]|uniref:Uncharacterized protein n=1 Tax=Streptomyces caniscabiei TaxID=2746961 RepID=A0A927KY57_9ACTN|nr:hypothetical protein [Streptomyces caniscabiei]MBD9721894.1 hypothetical protein [Streptomyces caniscabiei]MDX3509086.1 hypothetical protein [Streptomyces caniscabiei]MDX3717161.1 hypothetical protein [Streptomyces caniscabiei]WEO23028.1 hypothetical protein IHE65_07580 [Streptomyces caniscabiei]
MLDVAYEAVNDLPPGRLAKVDEDRGRIRVRLDRDESLAAVVRQLNVEIDQLMSSARWFQLWKDEIICSDTPGRPLRVEYLLCPKVPRDIGVGVAEDRGTVRVYICPEITTVQFAAFMTEATKDFLAGGHWFQLYAGEIIDNSPEPMNKV